MSENLISSPNVMQNMGISSDTPQQPQQEKNINITESVQILINGVQVAQKRGVYTLKEASIINDAVEFIVNSFKKTQDQLQKSDT